MPYQERRICQLCHRPTSATHLKQSCIRYQIYRAQSDIAVLRKQGINTAAIQNQFQNIVKQYCDIYFHE